MGWCLHEVNAFWEMLSLVRYLQIIMRLFMNPGDSMLCEEYTYPHVPESLVLPAGYESVKVEIDHHGIIPQLLEDQLAQLQREGRKIPPLLYTIPTGQNPTGNLRSSIITYTEISDCIAVTFEQATYFKSMTILRSISSLKGVSVL